MTIHFTLQAGNMTIQKESFSSNVACFNSSSGKNISSTPPPCLVAQLVKNPPAMQEAPVWFLGEEDCWRRDRLPTPVFLGFPGSLAGKESTWNVGDLGSIPGLGRSPGEGNSYPLKYSVLENSMNMGSQRIIHDWATFTFYLTSPPWLFILLF